MGCVQVSDSGQHQPPNPETTSAGLHYGLRLSRPLPVVDLSRTLASRWLSDTRYSQLARLIHTRYGLLTACTKLSGAVFVGVLFLPHRGIHALSAGLSLISIASQLSIAIFNSLDIWMHLLRNFEFHFMSTLNAANWAILAIIFSDIRILSCISMWSAIQIIIAMDASIRTSRHSAKAAAMSIPLMLSVAVACSYSLVPGGNFFIVHIPGLVVQGRNVTVFTSTTLSVFLAKKAIVTYWMLRRQAGQALAIPCAVLIGWLRFELIGVEDVDPSRAVTDKSKEHPVSQRRVVTRLREGRRMSE